MHFLSALYMYNCTYRLEIIHCPFEGYRLVLIRIAYKLYMFNRQMLLSSYFLVGVEAEQ